MTEPVVHTTVTRRLPFPSPPPPASISRAGDVHHAHGLSLLHGWLPVTVQIAAVIALVVAVGWRTRRWRLVVLPVVVAVGAVAAVAARWFTADQGLTGRNNTAPLSVWLFVGAAVSAVIVAILGWRGTRWWRRAVSVAAIVLLSASSAVAVNKWVGYFPTLQAAYAAATASPLPNEVSLDALAGLRNTRLTQGRIVAVDTPNNLSGMTHRTEYVYLPPAWFDRPTPPKLPAVMMIGGEFATPADWLRIGGIVPQLDAYAAAHGGSAPILVFPDTGGTFTNDTECVNGPRDNSATHLTAEVVPYVEKTFNASTAAANWGVAGFSMGGTCAIDLAVTHPELFGTFVDIAGDVGPNAGNKQQTIQRLYVGNPAQWNAFDPKTVMTTHGPYTGSTGLFYTFAPTGPARAWIGGARPEAAAAPHIKGLAAQFHAAETLYTTAHRVGIDAALYLSPGAHTWTSAAVAFHAAMAWLFAAVGSGPSAHTAA
ncbi:hypothetical protein FOS14_13940 [Skermania sp. ID1734]|uniref:alpha/beta hydrolase n=1 Tax=Skermania sp. ID1734 TaxID=2597516 RepID=UPI00118142A4|nr:alpha/beta hydrolase-fold protein [Skermania sp. ID1734]TSD98092.1 hypothetical protein FOS14_13940 [Skermania sp. ID1734]